MFLCVCVSVCVPCARPNVLPIEMFEANCLLSAFRGVCKQRMLFSAAKAKHCCFQRIRLMDWGKHMLKEKAEIKANVCVALIRLIGSTLAINERGKLVRKFD